MGESARAGDRVAPWSTVAVAADPVGYTFRNRHEHWVLVEIVAVVLPAGFAYLPLAGLPYLEEQAIVVAGHTRQVPVNGAAVVAAVDTTVAEIVDAPMEAAVHCRTVRFSIPVHSWMPDVPGLRYLDCSCDWMSRPPSPGSPAKRTRLGTLDVSKLFSTVNYTVVAGMKGFSVYQSLFAKEPRLTTRNGSLALWLSIVEKYSPLLPL